MSPSAQPSRSFPFPLAALALAALLASGCLGTSIFQKGAFAADDWDTWTGWNDDYGRSELKGNGLYYHLSAKQDDTRDEPSDGYMPGLILSRELEGARWRADLEADFKIPAGQMKRFSYGVWAGGDSSRPSIGNASAVMKLLVQRQNGPRAHDDSLALVCLPGGKPVALPKKLKVLRFERSETQFTVSYALNRKDFVTALSVAVPADLEFPSQKFFLGGFAGGDPAGAYARFKSLKINGREVLR
ncbi:MAG: hypothetical protein A2X32_00485 [Elusimicrobia bacterium GWC2_64_44]|nr:MAG: hypothetical protein A2X32_00485 [Elusimicrobia bacterium GWC2_64_44]